MNTFPACQNKFILNNRFPFHTINCRWPAAIFFVVCFLMGCSSAYKSLQPLPGKEYCVDKFKPQFTRVLYNTQVNVLNHHLGGLLLIKLMPDSSTRFLFTMETGFKFFDFEFSRSGAFKVYYITDKMNRKAVIKTLQKDFELVLMSHIKESDYQLFTNDGEFYNRFLNNGSYDYYITDSSCSELKRIEMANKRKTKTTITMREYKQGIPDTIGITHQNFNFNIGLKRLRPISR